MDDLEANIQKFEMTCHPVQSNFLFYNLFTSKHRNDDFPLLEHEHFFEDRYNLDTKCIHSSARNI